MGVTTLCVLMQEGRGRHHRVSVPQGWSARRVEQMFQRAVNPHVRGAEFRFYKARFIQHNNIQLQVFTQEHKPM